MAARKTTTKKSTKSAPKGKRAAQPQPEELGPILSRPVWGAIWGIVGLLCLLSILPIDGVLLKWLHRGIGALIGKGAYVMPFALIGIAVLLFARPKGPVRLRGTCIALMPLLIGSIIHAFSCANEYDLSMSTLSGLLSTGMEGSSGGLLGGGLYILLEWALSSIGALLILLVLFIVTLLVACRITPQALYDMVRPPEYEYEDEEERERYEAPVQLPNIHEAAAAHAQRREERRAHRKSDFDIPIDADPPGEDKPGEELIDPNKHHGKVIAPDEYLRSLRDNVKKKAGSIMDLVETKQPEEEPAHVSESEHEAAPAPASKPKKTENISEIEQAAMNEQIDESQKAPAPVYDYPPIDLLTQGKHASVAGAETELRESSACLLDTLDSFNIEAQIIAIVRGPSVTRFELTIPRGIKISRITALADDIALSLGAANVRIAPIPDKVAVGIEVPNKTVNTVFIRECIGSPAFANAKSRLSFAVGKDITGKNPELISKAGVARTFQNIRLFNEMSVLDNVKVGLHNQIQYGMWTGILRLPAYKEKEHEMNREAKKLLKIFGLEDKADLKASQLPYGEQRKLEIARALATNPKLLLLDEPAAGMNPSETAELTETIRRIRDEFNIAVLLIEHDMSLVMGICEGIAVLNFGRIIAKGTPDEIRNNPQVIEAYLGKKEG